VRELNALPSRLILDSGGFRYLRSGERPPTVQEVLARQLAILGGIAVPTLLAPLDSPLPPGPVPVSAVDQQIARTLANAFELQRLIRRSPLPAHIEVLAVVQGNDAASVSYCARELQAMGYRHFGLGSLARVPEADEIARRVAAVFDIIQRPLHLFGLGSPGILRQLNPGWVASVDSSRPAKAAACNEVFYSYPFRRYGIMTSDGVSRSMLPVGRCLDGPLHCTCPICQEDPFAILRIGRRDHIRARAVHNYIHLRAVLDEWLCGPRS
jgi:tRNA-guanine family transglycosylase